MAIEYWSEICPGFCDYDVSFYSFLGCGGSDYEFSFSAFVLLLGILAQILKLALKKYPSQALHYEAKTADGKVQEDV